MNRDSRLFILLATLIGAYVLLRAVLVPLVHDESASLLWFVRPGEWLPYHAHWDANNHFLSSGIGVFMCRAFGEEVWALRMGSLLAFALYAWGAWRIGDHVHDRAVRWCLWSALLLCPLVLDFFSLFRGYAIGLAGWLIAVDAVLRYGGSNGLKDMVLALSGCLLGNAAIVAMLPAWAIAWAVLFGLMVLSWRRLRNVQRVRQCVALIVLGILPMWYAAGIAFELQRQGLLYHGSTEGFIAVSVASLCGPVLGSAHGIVIGSVIAMICATTAITIFRAQRDRKWTSPAMLVHTLLWADVIARIAMAAVLKINFPEDRAGIHFVPLVVLCIALSADGLVERGKAWRWAAALLLLLPARALFITNVDHTLLWPEQSVPLRFVDRVNTLQAASARALLIGGHHQLALAWPLNAALHDRPATSLQVENFPHGEDDLRIVDSRYLRGFLPGYHAMDSAPGPGLWLLQRDEPMRITFADSLTVPARTGTDEFMEFAHLPDPLIREERVRVDVRLEITSEHVSPDVLVVLEVTDAAGVKLIYDAVQPAAYQGKSGVEMRFARTLPVLPSAVRAVLYLYNPRREELRVSATAIAVSIVR